jgi:two-component system, cell cycle response regulator
MQLDRRFIWGVDAGARGSLGAVQPESGRRSARHSCRVLVVDDDVLMRAQLCALLHESDYEVETAASGDDALRLLRSYPCDIVITDWQMPIMDGVALCRRVRSMEQHEHVYLLMLTIKRSPQELLTGFAAGADDYVVKGTSSEELLARLEKGRCLAHWRATHRSNDDDAGDLSLMDSVSGAYNLAYLMQHLPREMARAERHGRSLAVLNCEIYAAARANERLTDSIGDELMRGFASCSTTCVRKSDWLVRSGEKEFIIVLPETDEKGARCVARKLSEAFARRELPAIKEPLGGAIKFKLTAMNPAGDGAGAAYLRVLLRKAEGGQTRPGKRNEKRSADTGTVHYLNDLKSGGEAEAGRNWPAT